MTLTAHRTATSAVLTPARVSGRTAESSRSRPFEAGGPALTDLVRAVLTLTLVGALVLGVQLVVDRRGGGASGQSVLQTPYGAVEVGDVTVTAAVPAADKGMTGGHTAHGGAADAADVRVNVPIVVQNDSDAPVLYRPGQFRLEDGSGAAVVPQDNPLLTGELRPGAAVALRLTFALPAETRNARLVVDGGPAAGVDVQLPGATAPAQQMTPQDTSTAPSAPAPAPSGAHGH